LILEFETGGQSGYDPHPEWPGGASGITVGVGYDCGYYSGSVIDSDWKALEQKSRVRLERVSGQTGQRARGTLPTVRDIYVEWQIATDVFDNVDVAREFANAKRAMPGFEDLRPNTQAAMISLGFNRGWSMIGPNRIEMRDIRDGGVPPRDYERIAIDLRKMERVWRGTSIERGMTRRREAEAKLVETP
jgi:GH24 family phage-related lysozyme (muramidase)